MLSEWIRELGSQTEVAKRVTIQLAELGLPPEKPINQSTVSAWANGTSKPRGAAMAALEALIGAKSIDWCTFLDSTRDLSALESGFVNTKPGLSRADSDQIAVVTDKPTGSEG